MSRVVNAKTWKSNLISIWVSRPQAIALLLNASASWLRSWFRMSATVARYAVGRQITTQVFAKCSRPQYLRFRAQNTSFRPAVRSFTASSRGMIERHAFSRRGLKWSNIRQYGRKSTLKTMNGSSWLQTARQVHPSISSTSCQTIPLLTNIYPCRHNRHLNLRSQSPWRRRLRRAPRSEHGSPTRRLHRRSRIRKIRI